MKKSFLVDYDDSSVFPTHNIAKDAIAKHCGKNGYNYEFTRDDEVEINGKQYEVYRGLSLSSRGNYIIKCKEK